MRWRRLALVLILAGAARADVRPPEELFFDQPTPLERLVLTPPLVATSGNLRAELVEGDRLKAGSGEVLRLLLRCTAEAPASLPDTLLLVDTPFAVDGAGHPVDVRGEPLVRRAGPPEEAWLPLVVPGEVRSLSALAFSLGPPPAAVEQAVELPLDPLGAPHALPAVDRAVELSLLRPDDSTLLDVTPAGPPYFTGLDSTLGHNDPLPAAAATGRAFLTLRLHVMSAGDGDDPWRLANLRLTGADNAVVDDWRWVRRAWRPDWGGRLGVKGRDGERGVLLDGVEPGSPADKAGLRAGDLITAVGEQGVSDAWTLGERVRRAAPDSTLQFSIERQGQTRPVAVRLGRAPLWPDRDDLEFHAAWDRLTTARGAAGGGDVLAAWDWQTRLPLPAGFTPKRLELVFARTEPARGTTLLLRGVPLCAAR